MSQQPPHPASHLSQIDEALGFIDREIWIITAADGHRRSGLVATLVFSASIDPQRSVLLAALASNHYTAELVLASRAFGAHLLRRDQAARAWDFCKDSGRDRDKFADLTVRKAVTGAPILADSLAWFDCRVFARYNAIDRQYFWGDVLAASARSVREGPAPTRSVGEELLSLPLREYAFFQSLTDDQKQTLHRARLADAAALRALHDQWRKTNP